MAAEGSGTVGKALDVLSMLGEHSDGVTAGDVRASLGFPFSTTYRLLNTLVDSGFAEYEPNGKRYRLGLRVFQLGQKVAASRGFAGSALPALQRLTEVSGESSLLAVLDGDRFHTVHKIDGPQFRTTTDPGDRGLLHTSALGKALLAFAPEPERQRLLQSIDLPARTPHSITDRAALRSEVEQVRARGWAGQQEENDPGMAALAVPVLGSGGQLIAAVALASPIFRKGLSDLQHILSALRQAADELAATLPLRP